MKIRLSDIEGLLPGDHPYRDGTLRLEARHIDIFRDHPNAVFDVLPVNSISGDPKYVLGQYVAND